jgi:hypothetical protein
MKFIEGGYEEKINEIALFQDKNQNPLQNKEKELFITVFCLSALLKNLNQTQILVKRAQVFE